MIKRTLLSLLLVVGLSFVFKPSFVEAKVGFCIGNGFTYLAAWECQGGFCVQKGSKPAYYTCQTGCDVAYTSYYCQTCATKVVVKNLSCWVNTCDHPLYQACNSNYGENCNTCKADCGPCCTSTNPAAPTVVSPSDDSHLDVDVITLDWNAVSGWGVGCPSNNNQYQVYVEANDTTPDVLVATVGSATTSYDFTLTPGEQYYWQIVATNGSNVTGSAIWTFILDPLVEGTAYYDPDNACSTSSPSNFGGITASIRGTADTDAVAADGTFAVRTTYGGGYTLDMGVPAGHTCSVGPLGTGCGGGCPSQTSVFAPSVGNNFFFTDNPVAWWQVTGASVYSGSDVGGQTIRSLIPLTISASSRYLILSPPSGTDAVAIRRSGSLILSNGEVSSSGYSVLSGYGGKTYDYDFWTAQLGLGLNPIDDFASDSISKPINDPNKDFYYTIPSGANIDLNIPWSVASGESYVVLVDGDLRIDQNITVANGGFLAFIVNGDVDVDPGVTDVQGVFVIDGAFNTESQYDGIILDSQLGVEGTVVAWASVSLNRDLGDAGNAVGAAETFTYRPDFIINMPEAMKAFILRWREVPAGVIGD